MFHHVSDKSSSDTVTALLELGSDPFWKDGGGVTAIAKAALSNIEPRNKLKAMQACKKNQVIFLF